MERDKETKSWIDLYYEDVVVGEEVETLYGIGRGFLDQDFGVRIRNVLACLEGVENFHRCRGGHDTSMDSASISPRRANWLPRAAETAGGHHPASMNSS